MKFTVATNFQDDFIEKINKKEVYEIFGKLNADFIGGGRPSRILPSISRKKLRQHIREAHNNGLQFNYLLNAACLGNREFSLKGQREIHKLLGWLEEIEVDSVTVTVPYLLELIKKKYPRFKVCISAFAYINNLGKAKYWEDLGADLLNLESLYLNQDFEMLRKMRRYLRCELQLLVNGGCFRFCPFMLYHRVIDAHASQTCNGAGIFHMEYCILNCRYARLKDPVNFIRSDWIRPEDIHYYEEVGIDSLKIAERSYPTDSIALAVDAYTKRSYEGNLADLIPAYHPKSFLKGKRKFLLALKYLPRFFSINPFLVMKLSKVPLDLDVYVDNRALDGFLDFFVQGKCKGQGSCNECGYCYEITRKAVKIDEGYRQKMLERWREALDNILGVGGDKLW